MKTLDIKTSRELIELGEEMRELASITSSLELWIGSPVLRTKGVGLALPASIFSEETLEKLQALMKVELNARVAKMASICETFLLAAGEK